MSPNRRRGMNPPAEVGWPPITISMEEQKPTQPEDVTVTPTTQSVDPESGHVEEWDEEAIAQLLKNTPASESTDLLPPLSVLILWGVGLLIGAGSLVWFVASAVSVCSPNDSLCAINTLVSMMLSSSGMLLGAIVFVSGLFSLRRHRRRQ